MGYKKDDDFLQKFGKRVRELREDRCLTQVNLAHEAGLNFSQVARIERGVVNTSITNIKLLAKALKVHPRDLFEFDFENDSSAEQDLNNST